MIKNKKLVWLIFALYIYIQPTYAIAVSVNGSTSTPWLNTTFDGTTYNYLDNYNITNIGYGDDFNTGTLNTTKWSWIREPTSNWGNGSTYISINTSNTDMYATVNSPLLYTNVTPDENLTIVMNVTTTPTVNYQGASIVFYSNDTHWIRLQYAFDAVRRVQICSKAGSGTQSCTGYFANSTLGKPSYIKLVKNGNLYTEYHSTNRVTWVSSTSKTISINPTAIGITVFQASDLSTIPIDIDFFTTNNFTTNGNVTAFNNAGTGNVVNKTDLKIKGNFTACTGDNTSKICDQQFGDFNVANVDTWNNQTLNITSIHQDYFINVTLKDGTQTTSSMIYEIKHYITNVYTPPTPTISSCSQGNFWINCSWNSGAGTVTDSYNVSVNGTWTNGSIINYSNITVPPHNWSNISVYAYNSTGATKLNDTPLSISTQLINNPVAIGNISATYTIPVGNLLQIIPTSSDLDNDTLTFATDANKGTFYSNNGSLSWTPAGGEEGTYNWHINVTDGNGSTDTFNFSVSVDSSEPGQPLNLISSSGNFFINHTWDMSVNTDSFNVSVNGIWVNGSTSTFNNTTVLPHGYSNITVYGYNLTSGTLGNASSLNSQVLNNNPTIDSMSISAASITTAQTLTISAINASDLDGDNVTIMNVSVLFNLGSTTNYSMTNTVNTSNWTYLYSSGTAGSYTITAFYVSDNYSASNVYISASQGFTVTTPAASSTGSPGGGGTTLINSTTNQTILVGKTPIAPPTVTLDTISNTETGQMFLWGVFILLTLWFIKKLTTPNESVFGLLLPTIGMLVISIILGLWS